MIIIILELEGEGGMRTPTMDMEMGKEGPMYTSMSVAMVTTGNREAKWGTAGKWCFDNIIK